jgi:hypothetical protein
MTQAILRSVSLIISLNASLALAHALTICPEEPFSLTLHIEWCGPRPKAPEIENIAGARERLFSSVSVMAKK